MRRSYGQSMVEFALILPLLLLLLFGIIDLGWYVYNYASVNQAARNGSEAAAQLPPFQAAIDNPTVRAADPCYQTIISEVQEQVIQPITSNDVVVSYPDDPDVVGDKRAVGNSIQVAVTYIIQPLTPLFQTFIPIGNNGNFVFTARSVRSIESLGFLPATPERPNGVACDDGQ